MAIRNGLGDFGEPVRRAGGVSALPFPRDAFEAAIRAGGKGWRGSLRAFAAAYDAAQAPAVEAAPVKVAPAAPAVKGPARLTAAWAALEARAKALPAPVAEPALPGLRKVVEFQDLALWRRISGPSRGGSGP